MEAFLDCFSLNKIDLSDNALLAIESNAFKGTGYYKNPDNWKNGVLYIGKALIEAKSSELPTSYVIKSGTRVIAEYAFAGCKELSKITIPDGVVTIGSGSFTGCTNLNDISMPDSVINILGSAFDDTAYYNQKSNWTNGMLYMGKKLVGTDPNVISGTVRIKSGTNTIFGCCFYGCYKMTGIIFPESITVIPNGAFYLCEHLKKVILSSNLKIIEPYAFVGCFELTNISFPKYLKEIGGFAFSGTGMREATIPKTVKKISDQAFGYMYGDGEYAYYPGKKQKDFVIKGDKNTEAERYAKANGFKFIALKTEHSHSLNSVKIIKASEFKDGKKVGLCSKCNKTVELVIYYIASVTLSATKFTYNGKNQSPTVVVKDSAGKTLRKNIDYTVSAPSVRKNPGKYAVKVTFKGNYSGEKTLTYTIAPGTPSLTVTAGAKKATLKWNKQTGATGYVVYMSTSKSGKYTKVATVKGNSAVTYTKTGLTRGNTYYFKVQAYTAAGGKTINGAFSAVKSVKVK